MKYRMANKSLNRRGGWAGVLNPSLLAAARLACSFDVPEARAATTDDRRMS